MSEGAPQEGKALLRSGVVPAGAYANKIRRTLFAQLSQKIKSGEIEDKEVARAAGELNQLLYEAFVNKLALSKGDLVRVEIPYSVENGRISWDYSNLRVRAFREIGQEVVAKAIEEAVKAVESGEAKVPSEEQGQEERIEQQAT